MKILLHICCAPCAIYPLKILQQCKFDTMGFFYRHNIHPFTECKKREDTLKKYADKNDLNVIYQKGYALEIFLQKIIFRETHRCEICYHERLSATAQIAKKGEFNYFTTTLLYSKYQKHDMIKTIGEAIGEKFNIPFFYTDFREGWKKGIEASKQFGMYRQKYCGCIYSEKERFYTKND